MRGSAALIPDPGMFVLSLTSVTRFNRTAVNSHPQLDARMLLQGSANLSRAPYRFFRTVEEQQGHPVSRQHSSQFAAGFRNPETFGVSDDLIKFLQQFNLLVPSNFE